MKFARWLNSLLGPNIRARDARVEPQLQLNAQPAAQHVSREDDRFEPVGHMFSARGASLIERVRWTADTPR